MRLRLFLVVLTFASAAPAAHAQGGLADMFRSITGALRGGQEKAPQQQGVTATIGVRGMDEADAQAAAPSGDDYTLMEGWAATKPEAEHAAAGKGLAARTVTLKAKETRAAPPTGN